MNDQPEQPEPKPEQDELETPPFTWKHMWAFNTLMLYKTGGRECITQEQIDKFDVDNIPEVLYDHENKAWVMKLKDDVEKPVIVTVPRKLLKRHRKPIFS